MAHPEFLLIGKIVGVHGVKGTVKVFSYAESPSVFGPDSQILIRSEGQEKKACDIRWARPHKRVVLMSLKGVNHRDQAESLVGSEFFIEKANLPQLEEGTYYWSDIIGLSVFTTNERYVGRVESIITTGSNDVYVVKDKDEETLVPALESVVLSIDLEENIMQVELPEGL